MLLARRSARRHQVQLVSDSSDSDSEEDSASAVEASVLSDILSVQGQNIQGINSGGYGDGDFPSGSKEFSGDSHYGFPPLPKTSATNTKMLEPSGRTPIRFPSNVTVNSLYSPKGLRDEGKENAIPLLRTRSSVASSIEVSDLVQAEGNPGTPAKKRAQIKQEQIDKLTQRLDTLELKVDEARQDDQNVSPEDVVQVIENGLAEGIRRLERKVEAALAAQEEAREDPRGQSEDAALDDWLEIDRRLAELEAWAQGQVDGLRAFTEDQLTGISLRVAEQQGASEQTLDASNATAAELSALAARVAELSVEVSSSGAQQEQTRAACAAAASQLTERLREFEEDLACSFNRAQEEQRLHQQQLAEKVQDEIGSQLWAELQAALQEKMQELLAAQQHSLLALVSDVEQRLAAGLEQVSAAVAAVELPEPAPPATPRRPIQHVRSILGSLLVAVLLVLGIANFHFIFHAVYPYYQRPT